MVRADLPGSERAAMSWRTHTHSTVRTATGKSTPPTSIIPFAHRGVTPGLGRGRFRRGSRPNSSRAVTSRITAADTANMNHQSAAMRTAPGPFAFSTDGDEALQDDRQTRAAAQPAASEAFRQMGRPRTERAYP